MLVLEHGKPMIFGKDRDKGIRLNGLHPEVVTLGEDGVTEADLLVHDEEAEDPYLAYMLSRMWWPQFPVPVGVLRRIQRPTHDQLMVGQIDDAVTRQGAGDLEKLLVSGETWTVDRSGHGSLGRDLPVLRLREHPGRRRVRELRRRPAHRGHPGAGHGLRGQDGQRPAGRGASARAADDRAPARPSPTRSARCRRQASAA